MEYSFEWQDFFITINVAPGDAMDDPCDWQLISINYVDNSPCDYYKLTPKLQQAIDSRCEQEATNKSYDAWLDLACSRADAAIDLKKDS